MSGFWTASAASAFEIGWFVGNVSGALADFVLILLVASAPAYRENAPRAVVGWLRTLTKWTLWVGQVILPAAWAAIGWAIGAEFLSSFLIAAVLGLLVSLGPILLLFMFTAAGLVGRASAR